MLILGSSCFIGILISKKYANRVMELREFKNALNMLKTKIKFTYEPLPEIFNQIAKAMPQNISSFFQNSSRQMKTLSVKEAWDSSIDNANLNINKEDINVIKELGKMLRKNRCRRTS